VCDAVLNQADLCRPRTRLAGGGLAHPPSIAKVKNRRVGAVAFDAESPHNHVCSPLTLFIAPVFSHERTTL
jgi:hypothetical protein